MRRCRCQACAWLQPESSWADTYPAFLPRICGNDALLAEADVLRADHHEVDLPAEASRVAHPRADARRGALRRGREDRFVVQEHHARRLHWDLRLDRGGVLVSWALPKGLPTDPRANHLAIQLSRIVPRPQDFEQAASLVPEQAVGRGRAITGRSAFV